MTNYEIKTNNQFNSNEVYFNGKPNFEILKGLKALRMRWNPKKCCWYGFASQTDIINAITGATDEAKEKAEDFTTGTIYSDGYLGAIRTDGVNSKKYLFGKDLSKAIREHINNAGIKGVTISCKTYIGGQNITAKIKFTDEDIKDFGEYLENYKVPCSCWNYYLTEDGTVKDMHGEEFYSLSMEEQNKYKILFAKYDIYKAKKGLTLNRFNLSAYNEYNEEFMKKVDAVNEIIKSYHYDDSNSQVDYFETNFYYYICTVAS